MRGKALRGNKITYGGGKCELIRIGAFDDVDVALAHHISLEGIRLGSNSGNGFVSKVIRIKGKAAHAAGCPEKGLKFPLAREPYKTACSISSCFRKRLHSFSSSLSVNPYIAQSNKDGVFKDCIFSSETTSLS